MFLPIVVYGHPILRKISEDITPEYPELDKFIRDLFQTMDEADGVGLAAPQVGRNIRIFVRHAELPGRLRLLRPSFEKDPG